MADIASADVSTIFCGIDVQKDRLRELRGKRVISVVHRPHVRSAKIRGGFLSAHPFLQAIVSLGLIAAGCFALMHLIRWFRFGGYFQEEEAFLIALLPLGAWLLATAIRQGHYLQLETLAGRRRMYLKNHPTPNELRELEKAIGEWAEVGGS